MYDGPTTYPTIRNQRYDHTRVVAGRVMLGLLWVGAIALIVVTYSGPRPSGLMTGVILVSLITAAITLLIAVSGVLTPVARLKLGEDLQVYPSARRYPIKRIPSITIGPDPTEDYHDLPRPVRTCEVRVDLQPRGSVSLIASEPDAARLREWASARGIRISDTTGDNPRISEPDGRG